MASARRDGQGWPPRWPGRQRGPRPGQTPRVSRPDPHRPMPAASWLLPAATSKAANPARPMPAASVARCRRDGQRGSAAAVHGEPDRGRHRGRSVAAAGLLRRPAASSTPPPPPAHRRQASHAHLPRGWPAASGRHRLGRPTQGRAWPKRPARLSSPHGRRAPLRATVRHDHQPNANARAGHRSAIDRSAVSSPATQADQRPHSRPTQAHRRSDGRSPRGAARQHAHHRSADLSGGTSAQRRPGGRPTAAGSGGNFAATRPAPLQPRHCI